MKKTPHRATTTSINEFSDGIDHELDIQWTRQDLASFLPARFARAIRADRKKRKDDPVRSFILDYTQQFENDERVERAAP